MNNPHVGHRARMRARFRDGGLNSFAPHEILELLLFYGIPHRDTNPIAHHLIDTFGDIAGVLDAPYDELVKMDGVGENAATLLKMIPEVGRRYMSDRASAGVQITGTHEAGEFLLPRFYGKTNETVIAVCLDAKNKVLGSEVINEGGINSARVDIRKVIAAALKFNASGIILSHNHTSGIALPSQEDRAATQRVVEALATVDVALIDHIVVADDDFVSMRESGLI